MRANKQKIARMACAYSDSLRPVGSTISPSYLDLDAE